MSNPIECVVAYPSTDKDGNAARFDMDYYLATHMRMIDRDWKPFGMKTWSVAVFKPEDSLDGKTPRYQVQTTILWDKVEDLKAALAEGSKETMKDIGHYCDVPPEIWISKIAARGGVS